MIWNNLHITSFNIFREKVSNCKRYNVAGNAITVFSAFSFFLILTSNSYAQLSPGKLAKSHSNLEGLSNCTKCHTIGSKVDNQKCLTCHKDLNARVSANKGFHVSSAVKNKQCITCHSEHHGLNFDMLRFDKKTFNHNLTGYELKGAHKTKVKSCEECHKASNIVSPTLRKNPKTFLGLDTKCLTCHEDYHQKTLSNDCASCHDFNDFKPASLFNHAKADFPLLGAHKKVDCNECHKSEIRNGKEFVKYKDVSFNNCNSCHKDPHKGDYGTNCKSCHTEESFSRVSPSSNFNHSVTGFDLEGKHKQLNCKKCHDKTVGNSGTFKEFEKVKDIKCLTCHEDIHKGRLGTDCKSCHNQNSFLVKNINTLDKFDHSKTLYPLEGKHEVVDCRKCHTKDLTDPLPHNTCMSCHKDEHNKDFDTKKDKYPDCASCHIVDGFSPSLFTIEQHNKSKFKLEGAHIAQPCFSCHLNDKKWKFNNLGMECISCHKDIHEGKIDKKYYGTKSCNTCHNVDSWQDVKFDHKTTKFELTGGHQEVNCGECHMDYKTKPITQKFKDLSTDCYSCHKDVHGKQFEKNGITDCKECHTTKVWDSSSFNHDNTKFKLDGEHKEVACNECHKATLNSNKDIKFFKIEKYKCVDCHLK